MFDVIYYKNDTVVKVRGVKNSRNNDYINDAEVQILGIKEYGTNVTLEAGVPLTLEYETDSLGNYTGVLTNELDLTPNKKYTCMLQVLTQDGVKGYWEFTFTCRLRQD